MADYIWQTQDGFYSTAEGAYVQNPEQYSPLYMRDSDGLLLLADEEYLRTQLVFYGFDIPFDIMVQEEQIKAIKSAVQYRLDSFAQTRDYYDMGSACTYGCSTV